MLLYIIITVTSFLNGNSQTILISIYIHRNTHRRDNSKEAGN